MTNATAFHGVVLIKTAKGFIAHAHATFIEGEEVDYDKTFYSFNLRLAIIGWRVCPTFTT